ncbi:hypothetical protein B5E84_19360 [Lachnoclostridium sp. An14]|nr:hypothetical protein B5E84_19360 [Lachnoclostridium sp. An14]
MPSVVFLYSERSETGMIHVKIRPDGLSVDGHAGAGPYGHDIVCAAVSALTFTLEAALRELSQDGIESCTEPAGHVSVKWQKLSDTGRAYVDAWFLGICMVANSYNCITFV